MSLRYPRFFQRLGAWLAVAAIVAQPQTFLAAEQHSTLQSIADTVQAIEVTDVALDREGVLRGQLVDKQGRTLAATEVALINSRGHWHSKTDAEGRFQFAGLAGATYRVQTGPQSKIVRAWATGTAPPKANNGVLLVHDEGVVRGQHCSSPVCGSAVRSKNLLANPWVFGGIVAAAIAIPVAIHNADDDSPASP